MIELVFEAPAKVNLSLLVRSPDAGGYHPLHSVVQTIDVVDELAIGRAEEDRLAIDGADLPDDGSNLVWRAVEAMGVGRPPLEMNLTKRIAVAAGLGGGSADAAAALVAAETLLGAAPGTAWAVAPRVGADVRFLIRGGAAVMSGYGERLGSLDPFDDFALAIVVPPFELSTPEVYRRWDGLGGPVGDEMAPRALPPSLRDLGPIRNDLTPAAISCRPEVADWMAELRERWSRPVQVSGSGPSLFGFFADIEEAEDAAGAGPAGSRVALGVGTRPEGVRRTSE